MDPKQELLNLVDIHCKRTGLARATIATKVMNDGKFFDRLEGDGDISVRIYQRVKEWFKNNTATRSESPRSKD